MRLFRLRCKQKTQPYAIPWARHVIPTPCFINPHFLVSALDLADGVSLRRNHLHACHGQAAERRSPTVAASALLITDDALRPQQPLSFALCPSAPRDPDMQ
jgi:hypothetical protein